jgi:hypothetical protein
MKHAVTLTCVVSPVVVGALLFAGLVAALAIAVDISEDDSFRRPAVGLPAPWADQLVALEEALAASDVKAARWAFTEAYHLAFSSRRWEGMADVGDAAHRIGNPSKARIAYLTAAVRARTARSAGGIRRTGRRRDRQQVDRRCPCSRWGRSDGAGSRQRSGRAVGRADERRGPAVIVAGPLTPAHHVLNSRKTGLFVGSAGGSTGRRWPPSRVRTVPK